MSFFFINNPLISKLGINFLSHRNYLLEITGLSTKLKVVDVVILEKGLFWECRYSLCRHLKKQDTLKKALLRFLANGVNKLV